MVRVAAQHMDVPDAPTVHLGTAKMVTLMLCIFSTRTKQELCMASGGKLPLEDT